MNAFWRWQEHLSWSQGFVLLILIIWVIFMLAAIRPRCVHRWQRLNNDPNHDVLYCRRCRTVKLRLRTAA
jgi:hypothetical protein